MAFQAISELPTLVTKLGTSTATLVQAGSDIITIVTRIPSAFSGGEPTLTIPSILGPNFKLKIPKINLSATIISIPPSITPTLPELKSDVCHIDFSIFGSILKAIMFALTTIIDAVINSIISAICEAVQMFMVLVESAKQILEWLGNLLSNIWNEVKNAYNEEKEKLSDSKSSAEKALYKRIISWMEEKMKILGDICKELKRAIRNFFRAMGTVLEDIGAILLVFPKAIAELPSDICCMLKVMGLVTKYT